VTYSRGDAGKGGGINGTVLNIRNSIVAKNRITFFGHLPTEDISGAVTSQGHNLIGLGEGSTGLTDDPGCTGLCDKVGSLTTPLDPVLGPL
jgi:hypothetical protein